MPKLKSILIAEDEPDTANLLQFHLQRRGYHTTVASDGLNALNLTFERRAQSGADRRSRPPTLRKMRI
jgi:CheY-like chemotaxis protein